MKGGTITAGNDADSARVVAFYSYAGGAGRSCAVADIALILASQGYRVLAVDLDLLSPSLHRYLAAFLPGDGPAGRAPVRLDCQFEDASGLVDLLGPTTDPSVTADGLGERLAELAGRRYDYVLIDSPAGESGGVQYVTEELSDMLVLAYNLNKQAIDGVARRARAVQASSRRDDIRILPVPMRVDSRGGGLAARMRTEGRRQFADLVNRLPEEDRFRYWDDIEVPYEPDYNAGESLPFLDEPSEQRNRLLGSYLRLTALLTGDRGHDDPGAAAVSDASLARYRASRAAAAGGNVPVRILHAGPDRNWAEWLEAELRRLGLDAQRERIGPRGLDVVEPDASVLLVVSEQLLALNGIWRYLGEIDRQAAPGGHVALAVSVDGSRLDTRGQARAFAHISDLPFAGRAEGAARLELASYYGAPPDLTEPIRAEGVRYPGYGRRVTSNLPVGGPAFLGREDLMDAIRDHFVAPGASPLTLTGPAGIGKSQLALEYARRFGAQYDVTWVIRADSAGAARAGLAGLALDILTGQRHGDQAQAALRALTVQSLTWLLIYDGADSPAELSGLLPAAGRGHVLATSRSAPAESSAELPVAPFSTGEMADLLTGLLPELIPADALTLAADLAGNPLAAGLAASWIRVAARLLAGTGADPATVTVDAVAGFHDQLAEAAGAWPADSPAERAAGLLTELLSLDRHGYAATYLLQACAFLSPRGLSQRMLRSPQMLAQLEKAVPELSDPVVLQSVLRPLVTHGFLLPGESPRAPLQVHPLILEVVRRRMSPADLDTRSAEVARILAGSAPPDIDEDAMIHADVYAELQEHVEPSRAWLRDDPQVRRWLLNQVRYLWQSDSVSAWNTAAELGERLAARWLADLPAGSRDPLLLRLRAQLANIYRSRGQYDLAVETDRDVVELERDVLGVEHPRTLMTARGYAASLRLTGDFRRAMEEDYSTWLGFRQTLGDEHVLTLMASGNLAVSELLSGEPERALQRELTDLRLAGRYHADSPENEAWIKYHTGGFRRVIGDFRQSEEDLTDACRILRELVREQHMQPTAVVVLRAAASLAATRRRRGHPEPESTEAALRDCTETYGARHPNTLAIALSYAGDLHAQGMFDEALEQAQEALNGYAEVFRDHPFTWAAQVSVGSYALMAGDLDLADTMTGKGLTALVGARDRGLGPQHPWSLAALVARASVLAIRGRFAEAQAREEEALDEYRRRVRAPNPLIDAVQQNAAHTRMLLDRAGGHPPALRDARQRQLIELDIPST
jgi:cellulose biosynthesis protein BcsQ/tetratricopeptide (TPR) repeat protein